MLKLTKLLLNFTILRWTYGKIFVYVTLTDMIVTITEQLSLEYAIKMTEKQSSCLEYAIKLIENGCCACDL